MSNVCVHHPDRESKYYCAKYNRHLCEECFGCQDPTIYCKHRSSCMIWEIVKYGTPDEQLERGQNKTVEDTSEKEAQVADREVSVTFQPSGQTVQARAGQTVMEAAHENGVYINARCGGKGVCGSCKVKLESGRVDCKESILIKPEDREHGIFLACKGRLTEDVTIRIPEENASQAMRIQEEGADIKQRLLGDRAVDPLVRIVSVTLPAPSLDDPSSDLERLKHALSRENVDAESLVVDLPALRELARVVREGDWKVDVALLDHGCKTELIRTSVHREAPALYGLAVDVGTTSVVVYLVDLATGDVAGVSSALNGQVVCGEDVITRIIYAKDEEGLQKLHDYGMKTINNLVKDLLVATKIKRSDVLAASIAGNTVMTQSVLKLDPGSIRREPYVPTATRFPVLHAAEIDLQIHPRAGVFVVPGNAAYVGGDITAGIVSSGQYRQDGTVLFIDVGTNGEMALGNQDWLMTAACSAGPAFEGGGIRHGMRATPGAIEKVEIDADTLEPVIQTVGDRPAVGICGSGMISLIGSLYLSGILDSQGKFREDLDTERVRRGDLGPEYVLAWEKDAGIEEDVVITESDINTLILSKAAIYGGIRTLLEGSGLPMEAIDQFWIAGGFGKHIDFDMAVVLGMLPDVEREKFRYLGNSAIAGAYLALVSREIQQDLDMVSRNMTYIDFSSSNQFFDQYQQAMFLPHTEIRDFPSVKARMEK